MDQHQLTDDVWERIMLLLLETAPYSSPVRYGFLCSRVCKRWHRIACNQGKLWQFTVGADPSSLLATEYENILVSKSIVIAEGLPCNCLLRSVSMLHFFHGDNLPAGCSVAIYKKEKTEQSVREVVVPLALTQQRLISDQLSTTQNPMLFWRFFESSDKPTGRDIYIGPAGQQSQKKPPGFGRVTKDDVQTIKMDEALLVEQGHFVGLTYEGEGIPASPYRRPNPKGKSNSIFHERVDQSCFFRLRVGGCGWYATLEVENHDPLV